MDADKALIADYFGGDADLFASYKAMCLAQFANDVQAGDQACGAPNAQALRRVAHSLKSVLLTLGEPVLSDIAKNVEVQAHNGELQTACEGWQRLRTGLQRLASTGAGTV